MLAPRGRQLHRARLGQSHGQTAVLGQKVTERDRIDLNKQAHEKQAARVTILLNKPVGYVSAQAEKRL